MNRLLLLPMIFVAVGGCTFSDGDFFAVVEARLSAAIVTEDRELEDGWLRLASSYEIRIDTLHLGVGDIVLSSAASGGSFDPAAPPEGFSLCHNGHCHAEDGSLVDYEDIEALLGSGPGALDVMALHVEEIVYDGEFDEELECEPDCGLRSASAITGLRMPLVSLRASGLVRDARAEPRLAGEQSWLVDASLVARALVLASRLEVPVGRGESEMVAVQLDLPLRPAVFDTVDWATSPIDGDTINLSDVASQEALAIGLGELNIDVLVER